MQPDSFSRISFSISIRFKPFYEPPLLSLNIYGPMNLIHLDRPFTTVDPSMDHGPMCHPITFHKFQNYFVSPNFLSEIILNILRIFFSLFLFFFRIKSDDDVTFFISAQTLSQFIWNQVLLIHSSVTQCMEWNEPFLLVFFYIANIKSLFGLRPTYNRSGFLSRKKYCSVTKVLCIWQWMASNPTSPKVSFFPKTEEQQGKNTKKGKTGTPPSDSKFQFLPHLFARVWLQL